LVPIERDFARLARVARGELLDLAHEGSTMLGTIAFGERPLPTASAPA